MGINMQVDGRVLLSKGNFFKWREILRKKGISGWDRERRKRPGIWQGSE